jgi:hypothetical protein
MADGTTLPIEAKPELKVRCATTEDLDQIMTLAMMGTEENGFVPANQNKVLQEIWSALNMHQGVVGAIGEPGEMVEGAVLLRVGGIWYSDAIMIEEKAIFVHPSYRKASGGRAARLAEFSKWFADSLGLPLLIGVLSSHRTEAKVRMYTRIMGPNSGAYWIYWPKGHPQHVEG